MIKWPKTPPKKHSIGLLITFWFYGGFWELQRVKTDYILGSWRWVLAAKSVIFVINQTKRNAIALVLQHLLTHVTPNYLQRFFLESAYIIMSG